MNKIVLSNLLGIFEKKSTDKQLDLKYSNKDDTVVAVINICKYSCFTAKKYYIVSIMKFTWDESDSLNVIRKGSSESKMYSNIKSIVGYLSKKIDLTNQDCTLEINNIDEVINEELVSSLRDSVRNGELRVVKPRCDTRYLEMMDSTVTMADEIIDIWRSNGTYDKINIVVETNINTKKNIVLYFNKVDECNAYTILIYLPLDDSVTYALDNGQFRQLISHKIEQVLKSLYSISDDPRFRVKVECYKEEEVNLRRN